MMAKVACVVRQVAADSTDSSASSASSARGAVSLIIRLLATERGLLFLSLDRR